MNNYHHQFKINNAAKLILLKALFIIILVALIYLLISIQKVIFAKYNIKDIYTDKITKLESKFYEINSHNYKLINKTLLLLKII